MSLPPRRYDIAARVLARAVAEPGEGSAHDRAVVIAQEEGRSLGGLHRTGRRMSASRTLDTTADVLAELGYEPTREGGCVRLRNCPFHAVVDVAPTLVCELNGALIGGILDGLEASDAVTAELDGVATGLLRDGRQALKGGAWAHDCAAGGEVLRVTSWPATLTLVRHGESLGNVANERAYADKAEHLDLAVNDPSVELSDLGVRQAEALGKRLGDLPVAEQPTVVVVSTYVRAQQTADHVLATAGPRAPAPPHRRAAARPRAGHARPAHLVRRPSPLSGGGGAARLPRQVLVPPARR